MVSIFSFFPTIALPSFRREALTNDNDQLWQQCHGDLIRGMHDVYLNNQSLYDSYLDFFDRNELQALLEEKTILQSQEKEESGVEAIKKIEQKMEVFLKKNITVSDTATIFSNFIKQHRLQNDYQLVFQKLHQSALLYPLEQVLRPVINELNVNYLLNGEACQSSLKISISNGVLHFHYTCDVHYLNDLSHLQNGMPANIKNENGQDILRCHCSLRLCVNKDSIQFEIQHIKLEILTELEKINAEALFLHLNERLTKWFSEINRIDASTQDKNAVQNTQTFN